MSKKAQKESERQLIEIINSRANNNRCGECHSPYPTWASYTLGIFLCGRCASAHKRALPEVSKVKSLTLDSWSQDRIDRLRRAGNKKAMAKWNPHRAPFPYDADDNPDAVDTYLRDKYINGRFRDDTGSSGSDIRSYDDKHEGRSGTRSRSGSYVSRESRGESRARGPVPRLTHRKPTTFESTLYQSQVAKIMSFGYTNRDSVLESLLLTEGSIEDALDVLDAPENQGTEELPPELPKRPINQNQTTQTTQTTQTNQTQQDWWSGSTSPQIYQYTDPVTGQVSYVDQNGQQYMDPSNPQHQQAIQIQNQVQMANQAQMQAQAQLIAQQTNKQNILSLYGQNQAQQTNQGQTNQGQTNQGQTNQGQAFMGQGMNVMQPTGYGFGQQVPQYGYVQPQYTQYVQYTGFQPFQQQ